MAEGIIHIGQQPPVPLFRCSVAAGAQPISSGATYFLGQPCSRMQPAALGCAAALSCDVSRFVAPQGWRDQSGRTHDTRTPWWRVPSMTCRRRGNAEPNIFVAIFDLPIDRDVI
jgi:hypothetical protein